MSQRKSNQQFEEELHEKNSRVLNLKPYNGARTKIPFQCKKCGYIWDATPDSVLRGSGCGRCAGTLRKTHKEFVDEVKNASPKIEVLGEYKNNRSKVKCRCRVCGYEWSADPIYLCAGSNCPNCVRSGTSFVEQCIFLLFESYFGKGKVKSRNKTAIGKELDVFVPDERIAVEFGSWFWHKEKVDQDIKKIELCRNQNISFVIIYDSYNGSESLSERSPHFVTYSDNLSNNDTLLRMMLEDLFHRFEIDLHISEELFSNIKHMAYERCSQKNTAFFQSEVKKVNPNIKVIGQYTTAREKILCTCMVCGHKWTPFADNLLRGQGCPNCAKRRISRKLTLTHDEFMARVEARLNPNVELIGEYTQSKEKIECRCKKCGYMWKALPGDLYHGSGCPKCGGTMKKTHRAFINALNSINPNIEMLEKYTTNDTPVKCKCLVCQYEWKPLPKHLLAGHGCPKCNGGLRDNKQAIIERIQRRGLAVDVLGKYKNSDTPLRFKCQKCGFEWDQIPRKLLKSRGCPKCFPYTEEQDRKWFEYYKMASDYYKEHGSLRIAARACYCGVELGRWVHCQRRAYRNSLLPAEKRNKSVGSISDERIEMLNKIGMVW